MVGSFGVLVAAIRTPAARLPRPSRYWPFLLVLLVWTGDAALGDGRPAFERAGKATIAVLLWSSLAIVVLRRRRAAGPATAAPLRDQPDGPRLSPSDPDGPP
ncbi:hypothetical protein AMIS_42360 [Actinoplanes missouriensis 431]|uniref:Uncharacterized protein n=1 Tax=Actinoplanes missouriensis (strain ATCC 14538 / DSM 43046 / CBS 188.64 / JCM 3121 / NBRC 102363 / NCIMB 12654 / NRRL B-3342 / UNCC 431) TaxID=512565 RepID=I0H8W9_ACTM4|nr:hypothetical protein AMIS_42360 [Actinoplanes missouriensis 431]